MFQAQVIGIVGGLVWSYMAKLTIAMIKGYGDVAQKKWYVDLKALGALRK
jgi:hypothetical protein